MADSDTLVFIPAWNEEANLPAVLDELHAELPDCAVLVVDDGSTDGTAAVAAAHGAEVLSFGENRGLREGIAAGYAFAHERGYDYVGRVDADGQHPVDELARLIALVRSDAADVAVGSRFATGEGYEAYRYEPSASRRVGTSVLRRAMHPALGRPFLDATSGMYAANRSAMPVLGIPYTSGAPGGRVASPSSGRRSARRRGAGPHARARERTVEAAGQQGTEARGHGREHAPALRRVETPAEEQLTRLVAVLGYSDATTAKLHPVCAARLACAAAEARADDVVLFSGWARGSASAPEADLMARMWTTPARVRLVDRRARTTLGNAVGVARAARRVGADEVVLVTSRWHARRAAVLVRAALAGSGTVLRVVATDERATPRHGLREAASWTVVPVLALVATRSR